MIDCHAAFLVLELKYSQRVIVNNCTIGNWTFTQVQQVVIKNCSNSITKRLSTTLNFNNSSGLIENIAIRDLNFSLIFEGFILQNYSNIEITKSNFVNNTVNYGLIKVLSSSTLVMSNSIMQQNQARDYAGAIFVVNSVVHITDTNFYGNKAVEAGGAICAFTKSSLWIAHSTFKNNQIPFRHSNSNISKYSFGGAIYFKNKTVAEMHNVNFTNNTSKRWRGNIFLTS